MNAVQAGPERPAPSRPRLLNGVVVANNEICREHRRLVIELDAMPDARPGQFLHLGSRSPEHAPAGRPFLRRGFSIGGLHAGGDRDQVDIIYRIVGAGTQWMGQLAPGDVLSALGPLGRGFWAMDGKPVAWLVAGGVGLPPLLWWAEWLHRSGTEVVAFCGARSRDLVPLDITDPGAIAQDASRAALAARDFAQWNVPVVISTDDGTLGFHGTVGVALDAYFRARGAAAADVAVYCCGPERMLEGVARWSLERQIACQLCMEREMACGTGTCQSCVVPIRDAAAEDGWRYALCCSEGPVFDARDVLWP